VAVVDIEDEDDAEADGDGVWGSALVHPVMTSRVANSEAVAPVRIMLRTLLEFRQFPKAVIPRCGISMSQLGVIEGSPYGLTGFGGSSTNIGAPALRCLA
jgi:hypothetical protein